MKHLKLIWIFSFYLLLSSFIPSYAASILPEDNSAYPALIDFGNGFTGSGFYLNDKSHVYFVTAKHVLFDLKTGALKSAEATLISYDGKITSDHSVKVKINLQNLYNDKRIKAHKNFDVAVAYIGDLVTEKGAIVNFISPLKYLSTPTIRNKTLLSDVKNFKSFDDVIVGNDVYLFGYPTSLILLNSPQFEKNKPLIRKGIVAGKNTINKTIILDCPVYYGNSGGPVIQLHGKNLCVIGIAVQLIPAQIKKHNSNGSVEVDISNSGYSVVVPTDAILDLLWH